MKQKFEEMKAKGPAKPQQGPVSMKQNLPGVKHIIAVSSAKVSRPLLVLTKQGGVGKSTCAVNIALALSSLGLRVCMS